MPRNSENDPSVTMSGGMLEPRDQQRVQRAAGGADGSSASGAAAAIGSPQSRDAAPNTPPRAPSSTPTDRSMPPVMMTGVSAMREQPELDAEPDDLEEVPDA